MFVRPLDLTEELSVGGTSPLSSAEWLSESKARGEWSSYPRPPIQRSSQHVQRPPPPYPGGPSAPLIEEKNGQPVVPGSADPVTTGPPQGHPLPPDYGPPPYEATLQPGFLPPHVPGDMPMPHGGFYPPPGHFGHAMPGQFGPGPIQFGPVAGQTAHTVLAPPGTATTVTVLQGEMFQSAPVQTVCHHCQLPIVTRINHSVGLMNAVFCLFCFFVGCDLGCCLIPCLIDDLKDVIHTCPYCKGYIYTYKRIC